MPPQSPADHRRMHERHWTREEAIAFLDDPERRRSQDPQKFWRSAGLRTGQCVVDIGAGSGFYAFPAGKIVGRSGCVFAVDVSPELVTLLFERRAELDQLNVTPVHSTARRIPLPNRVADMVLLANVLHGIPPATLREAVRLLAPRGSLVNVDWKKESTPGGPPVEHRLSPAEAEAVLGHYGLREVRRFAAGPYHYAARFIHR